MVNQEHTLLIVDDDDDIRITLSDHLRKRGFGVHAAGSAEEARNYLEETSVDLVILDIMMPGEDGLSLCRHLQDTNGPPVILLTALSDDTDKIVGLEIGADDYVSKPFNPRELLARIKAVLRRSGASSDNKSEALPLTFGPWTLDDMQSEITKDTGLVVSLSAGELALLKALLSRAGDVLSRDDLMQLIRGREVYAFERSIDNSIARLRKKIEVDPGSPRIIKTVRGGGYCFVRNPAP